MHRKSIIIRTTRNVLPTGVVKPCYGDANLFLGACTYILVWPDSDPRVFIDVFLMDKTHMITC